MKHIYALMRRESYHKDKYVALARASELEMASMSETEQEVNRNHDEKCGPKLLSFKSDFWVNVGMIL